MKRLTAAFAVLSAMATAIPVYGACTQANMTGTWTAFTSTPNGNSYVGIGCILTIGSNGAFISKSSSCVSTNGLNTGVSDSLVLANAALCSFRGSIILAAFGITDVLSQTTLSKYHDTLAGVGFNQANGFGFTFNMVQVN
jgi:hypothetical protein